MYLRILTLALLSFAVAGCELIGDIFQAGFVVGILAIIVILAVVGWIWRVIKGRGRPS